MVQSVKEFYALQASECQIVGPVADPQKNLKCAHVAPRRMNGTPAISRYEIPNTDTLPRNFIFLQREIEVAFDLGQVAFLDDGNGNLVLEILDSSLLAKPGPLAGTAFTWALVSHRPLNLPLGCPYRRLLAAHAAIHIQKYARSLTYEVAIGLLRRAAATAENSPWRENERLVNWITNQADLLAVGEPPLLNQVSPPPHAPAFRQQPVSLSVPAAAVPQPMSAVGSAAGASSQGNASGSSQRVPGHQKFFRYWFRKKAAGPKST
jgi:hypothetical protein